MLSLRDIVMDADVEPFQSRDYKMAKETVKLHTASDRSIDKSPQTLSPILDDNSKEVPIERRRSNRVTKPASHNAAREAVGFYIRFQVGSSNQPSTSDSPQHSSPSVSDPRPDMPIKYTPVTGRISRAKKGVPVHICDRDHCRKIFTRAEHLRRHQLSHQEPACPCPFEHCEKVFHRPDLLARHLQRHETQGQEPCNPPGPRSRASSNPSDSRTPPLTVRIASTRGESAIANQTSTADYMSPRTSASTKGSMMSFSTITDSILARNFSPAPPFERSAHGSQLAGADSSVSPRFEVSNYDASSSQRPGPNSPDQGGYSRQAQPDCSDIYFERTNADFPNTVALHALPFLPIPEDTKIPDLSHTQGNSPRGSSASDSSYSTRSDGSRTSQPWSHRARSGSVHTVPDWLAADSQLSPPYGVMSTPQTKFDTSLEQFEMPHISPRITPSSSSRQPDIPDPFGGDHMESVGTPVLTTYGRPLAQDFSASTSQEFDPRSGGADIKRKVWTEPRLGTLHMSASMIHSTPLDDPYMSSYWEHFDRHFPIVHRGTFDPTENSLLSSAMAAIGTQYHNTTDARQKGIELNHLCRGNINHFPNWDLRTMQAILLTELFTRFRGRQPNVKTSRQFEEVYRRLLDDSSQGRSQFSTHSTGNDALVGHQNLRPTTPQCHKHSDLQKKWVQWIDAESRQRLLAFCFMFDVHQSLYHGQKRTNSHHPETNLLFPPCPDNIWSAASALEWQAQQVNHAVQPLDQIEDLYPQDVSSRSLFTQSLLTCSLASRFPTRDSSKCPNDHSFPNHIHPTVAKLKYPFSASPLAHSYLALHHTPLLDLLAIAGDTWVFGKKIAQSAFSSAQLRLKTWSSTLNAAIATQHACHILSMSFSQSRNHCPSGQVQSHGSLCISHYWAIYTSALICWAFGYRHQPPASGTPPHSNSSTTTKNPTAGPKPSQTPADENPKALAYIDSMLKLPAEALLTSRAQMRGETADLIEAVRVQLESDSVGGKCALLDEALDVLTKIQEPRKKKYF